jgi:hypothetical protein
MELVLTDLSLYVDDKYTILNDPYVRMMVLAIGYDSYMIELIDIEYTSLMNKEYITILESILRGSSEDVTTTMLVYTIVRYLYPHRKVGIFYRQPSRESEKNHSIELYYLDYNWNNDIPEGCTSISTIDELMKSIVLSFHTDSFLSLTWKVEEVLDRVPDLEDGIEELISTHPIQGVIGEAFELEEQLSYWVSDSLTLIRDFPIYDRIMKELPPYNSRYRVRTYTYGEDTNFLFQ